MEEAVPILVIIFGALIAVVAIATRSSRLSREAGYAARLKQLMIERGMNADEIERVIAAKPSADADKAFACGRGAGSPRQRKPMEI